MRELTKIRDVVAKRIEGAPHEVMLVLDATTGQNGIQQAKNFGKAINVTGIMLAKLDGKEIKLDGGATKTLALADAEVTRIEPGWRYELLALITDPNVAYILLMIGIYGLILEFYNPGMAVPGVTGVICLLLALSHCRCCRSTMRGFRCSLSASR